MSSFKKREKALRRTHRERAQPSSRRHLGLLEKHKDYTLRARDFHKKQAQLKILHEKARNRNPDEFYFKMVNSKLKGGCHVVPNCDDEDEEELSAAEKLLMQTQDIKYIQLKLSTEKKKVERLQANFHLMGKSSKPKNTHKIFVDTPEEVVNFNPAEYFDTYHKHDQTRKDGPQEKGERTDEEHNQRLKKKRKKRYKVMMDRVRRCRELQRMEQKMQTQKHLMKKERCFKVPGDDSHPRSYRWFRERKK